LVHAFGKSNPAFDLPDFYLSFIPASFKAGLIGKLDDYAGCTVGASPMRPESRGWVRIISNNPRDMPMVQPNYLAEESDRRIAIAAGRAVRAILEAPAMKPYVAEEILPGPNVQNDDEWLDFIRANGMSGYHFCGTCKMGPATDPQAVVDDRLRVHGTEALYVVDASIMPRTPSANTMAGTYMIAEKASDMLLGRPPLPAAIL
jgi:choline dehydrogenase